MRESRRKVIEIAGKGSAAAVLLGSGWLSGTASAADMPNPLAPNDQRKQFDTHTLAEVVKDLGGSQAQRSDAIELTAPEIAENGAVVPVQIESKLPGTKLIAILTEKNPRALTAVFHIPDGTEPWVATRVKLAETAKIIALVQSDDGFHYAEREVKVTLGGCGG